MSRINLYSVFTFLKFGLSELFSFFVANKYNFDPPLQPDFCRGLLHSEKDHQISHDMTTSNTSTGKKCFGNKVVSSRQPVMVTLAGSVL